MWETVKETLNTLYLLNLKSDAMRYFEIDVTKLLKINLFGKETLIPPRAHLTRVAPEHILYVVTDGELYLEENGKEICLKKGDIYFFKKGDYHRPIKTSYCSYYYIHFNTDWIKEFDMEAEEALRLMIEKSSVFLKANIYGSERYEYIRVLLGQKISLGESKLYEYIVNKLESYNSVKNYYDMQYCLDISYKIAGILLKLENFSIEQKEGKAKVTFKTYSTVKKLIEYIDDNFTADINRQTIEKEFYLNYDYVNRIFKKNLGMSIAEYRNYLRINKAKIELAISDKTISQIAYEVGFYDSAHFCKLFRKSEGISPGAYRKSIFNIQEK